MIPHHFIIVTLAIFTLFISGLSSGMTAAEAGTEPPKWKERLDQRDWSATAEAIHALIVRLDGNAPVDDALQEVATALEAWFSVKGGDSIANELAFSTLGDVFGTKGLTKQFSQERSWKRLGDLGFLYLQESMWTQSLPARERQQFDRKRENAVAALLKAVIALRNEQREVPQTDNTVMGTPGFSNPAGSRLRLMLGKTDRLLRPSLENHLKYQLSQNNLDLKQAHSVLAAAGYTQDEIDAALPAKPTP
jgi:hypothetical protein